MVAYGSERNSDDVADWLDVICQKPAEFLTGQTGQFLKRQPK